MSDKAIIIVFAAVLLVVWHGMAGVVVWLHKRLVRSRTATHDAWAEIEPLLIERRQLVRAMIAEGETTGTVPRDEGGRFLAAAARYNTGDPLNGKIRIENEITSALAEWRSGSNAALRQIAIRARPVEKSIAAGAGGFNGKAAVFNLRMAASLTKVITWVMELVPFERLTVPEGKHG